MARPVLMFAFANDPGNKLNLSKEERTIRKALTSLHDEKRVELFSLRQTELQDVQDIFNRYYNRLQIFHFGGHSDKENMHLVDGEVKIENLLPLFKPEQNLNLVFLNGCANKENVQRLFSAGVKAVIATSSTIKDESAIAFSEEFYKALAAGKTLKEAYGSAAITLKNENPEKAVNREGMTWRNADHPAGNDPERGLAFRTSNQEPPWGLYFGNDPKIADWRLPRKKSIWRSIIPLLLFLPFSGWFTAQYVFQLPFCPDFSQDASFKIAVVPFDVKHMETEKSLRDELLLLNNEHRKSHPGRELFFSEAGISRKKSQDIHPDSILRECGVQMVIWGKSMEDVAGKTYAMQLNVHSTAEVAIDDKTRLGYNDLEMLSFADSVDTWAAGIFSLIDGHFKCFDPALANRLKADLAKQNPADPGIADRLQIATQYHIKNNRIGDAIALFAKYRKVSESSPTLIRNFGLSYLMGKKKDFRNASKIFLKMPVKNLDQPFLMFRWKTLEKAAYYNEALNDIDRLLKMNIDDNIRQDLINNKSGLKQKIQASRLNALLSQMESEYRERKWSQANDTGNRILQEFPSNQRAAEVLMDTYYRLGKRDDALRHAETVMAVQPANPLAKQVVDRLMNEFLKMGESRQARAAADLFLKTDPANVPARLTVMKSYSLPKDWKNAIPAAEKVLKYHNSNFEAYRVLVLGGLALKDTDSICAALDRAKTKVSVVNYQRLYNLCPGGCCIIVYD